MKMLTKDEKVQNTQDREWDWGSRGSDPDGRSWGQEREKKTDWPTSKEIESRKTDPDIRLTTHE